MQSVVAWTERNNTSYGTVSLDVQVNVMMQNYYSSKVYKAYKVAYYIRIHNSESFCT